MPYDPEDETGWDALPAISDNEDDRAADSIGPLHTGVDPYIYRLQREDIRTLTLTSQPEKVMLAPAAASIDVTRPAGLKDIEVLMLKVAFCL